MVATVHKDTEFSVSHLYGFVHGIVNAFVALAYPISDVVSILTNQFDTAIGRATINDNVFNIGRELLGYRTEGLF